MRVIHYSAADRWEAVVFTEEPEEEPAEDFVHKGDLAREGFTVDFDDEVALPAGLCPSDADPYVKQP